MTLQDVHKTVKVQMKCNFRVEELHLLIRSLEAYNIAQLTGRVQAEDPQEYAATKLLLQRIS